MSERRDPRQPKTDRGSLSHQLLALTFKDGADAITGRQQERGHEMKEDEP
ncbi:MAG TPA: hypothetical protein PKM73_20440 [Verrucomicrobiota bacterium]|nr:hypothetical protein [Verrucomicrobiota bacterium]